MKKVFIYWDNSNIFIGAGHVAEEREGNSARYRTRISFNNLLKLAHAERPIEKAVAVGSVPPELRHVWNRLEHENVRVELLERGSHTNTEQGVDQVLQVEMLRDFADYNGNPGIVVLLTGDGKGFYDGIGFHADIERMHRKGWRIEVLSWQYSCNPRMQEWVKKNGLFIALDDFYESITYLQLPADGHPYAEPRHEVPLNLEQRPQLD